MITGDQPREILQVRRTVAQRLDHEVVSSQRPDGGATSSDASPRARSLTTTSTSPARNVSNIRPNRCSPRRRVLRSGVLEVEDRGTEASQVVPLLTTGGMSSRTTTSPTSREASGRAFHQSRLR
jgi:hypothetical protein